MALFRIVASRGNGLTDYSFKIHDSYDVPMKHDEGCVEIDWITCGSGSNFVKYTLEGPVGASLRFTIFCGERQVHQNERRKQTAEPETHTDSFQN